MSELEKAKKIFEKINKEENLKWVIIVLIGIIVVFAVFPDIIPNFNPNKEYKVKTIEIKADCEECFDLTPLTSNLQKENIKLDRETLNYNSEEAKKLIKKYDIKRVPALILISKNIEKIGIDENIFFIGNNYAVFDKSIPYLDLISGQIKGLVDLKEISDSSCLDCAGISILKKQLESAGVKIKNYEVVFSSSIYGKELINENSLTFLSSLLISKNINEYWWLFEQIKNLLIEKENYYVFKNPSYPYKEISTGKIKGKTKITYLTNNSCLDCFDVTQLKEAFQNLGVYIESEKYVDVSSAEGKNLLSNYNITAIPTIILSEEISDYLAIKDLLEKVGSFENKKFVFRKLDALQVKYQKVGGE